MIVLGVGGLVAVATDVCLRFASRGGAAGELRRRPDVRRMDRADVSLGRRGRDAHIVKFQQPLVTDSQGAPPLVAVRLATRRRRSPRIVAPRRPPNRAARHDM